MLDVNKFWWAEDLDVNAEWTRKIDEWDNKTKLGEVLEILDIPQWLKDYREARENNIRNLDEGKKKIIEAVKKIELKAKEEKDWSRLIEFRIWNRWHKILDVNLENHTDENYKYSEPNYEYSGRDITGKYYAGVTFPWMVWDVNDWENKELQWYVKQKMKEWLHLWSEYEMNEEILWELWCETGLKAEGDLIAMLMYLTGMEWWYRWSMLGKNKRSILKCSAYNRWFNFMIDNYHAGLCMVA